MKKKPGKYLKFYYECMENGRMPSLGLCACFPQDQIFQLFGPGKDQENNEGLYWGAEYGDMYWPTRHFTFTERRQTIVLLMAALNNEL